MKPIRVLIVDDSATIRAILRAILQESPQIMVCGEAADAYEARAAIKALSPDVVTLDVEMPKMDGITFLRNLMRLHPVPTIMLSVHTQRGSAMAVEALAQGAVDCVHKPHGDDLESVASEIISKVIIANRYNAVNHPIDDPSVTNIKPARRDYLKDRLIAIGASTGGIPAIERVISTLPVECPPIVITQHISEYFSTSLANRLNNKYPFNVYEAQDNQIIEEGSIYMAPGDDHLEVVKKAGRYYCQLNKGKHVCYQRPSVDVLFESVAIATKGNASAALLTGMGRDGAEGMLSMKEQGCYTVIQDEASSVVWGMPGEAASLGAAQDIVHLNKIAQYLLKSCHV
ncbi:MAG: chemotaxis response regulator protein-glutamate methylesterase [Bermanella sp.]